MTKLDYLKKCKDFPKVKMECWHSLGAPVITENTHYLAAGMIYKLDAAPLNGLNGAYIFCNKELTEGRKGVHFSWDTFKKVYEDSGIWYTSFSDIDESSSNLIISPNLFIILLPEDDDYSFHQSNVPREGFVPFESSWINNILYDEESKPELDKIDKKNNTVHINEKDYENCIKCLGYPFISEDELEYSREDILNFAIKPSLEEYFHWIPAEVIMEYPITGTVQEIDFPENAYDVLGVSVQQRGTHGSGNITNTLLRYFDEAAYGTYNYSGMTGNYKGTFKPHTAQGGPESFISNRALVQATTNLNTRVHFDKIIKPNGKKVLRIYSNKLGAFNIHWAVESLNFDDIEYQQRQNVFKYCQAEVKELFGNLRRQAKADIPGAIDYNTWVTEAEEAKKEVVEDWKQLVKASSIMRGSL